MHLRKKSAYSFNIMFQVHLRRSLEESFCSNGLRELAIQMIDIVDFVPSELEKNHISYIAINKHLTTYCQVSIITSLKIRFRIWCCKECWLCFQIEFRPKLPAILLFFHYKKSITTIECKNLVEVDQIGQSFEIEKIQLPAICSTT